MNKVLQQKQNYKFNILKNINVLCLSLVVFILPLNQKIISPFIGLWVLSSLLHIILNRIKFKMNKPLLLLIGFYFILVVGVLWSNNKGEAGFDLEVKMSLALFPLLFLFIKLTINDIKKVLNSFLIGILLSSLYLLYNSYLLYIDTNDFEMFFYSNLSDKIHPSYMSNYIVLVIVILLVDLKYQILELHKNKLIYVLFIIYLFSFNILLLSKIGIISSVVILSYFVINWVVTKHKYLLGFFILAILCTSLYVSYKKVSFVNQRVNELITGLTVTSSSSDYGSTEIRIKIWKEGMTLIKNSPFIGYGTGDVKDVLMKQYLENDIMSAHRKKLNAHNQFIQVAIAIGGVGFLYFCYLFFISIKNGIIQNKPYFVAFIVLSILYMLPESTLENQAGTIFFGLFFSLLNQESLRKI